MLKWYSVTVPAGGEHAAAGWEQRRADIASRLEAMAAAGAWEAVLLRSILWLREGDLRPGSEF